MNRKQKPEVRKNVQVMPNGYTRFETIVVVNGIPTKVIKEVAPPEKQAEERRFMEAYNARREGYTPLRKQHTSNPGYRKIEDRQKAAERFYTR